VSGGFMNLTPQTFPSSAQESVILVVDDVQQNIQVVGTLLREAGYSIMPATSGAAALQRVGKKLPDLILLDLMMPELDGLEVCRRLKSAPETKSIPIIFLTASNEMEHLVQGLAAGAVDYVTKPFNPPELLARVQTHLELKHARDTIVRYGDELRRLNEEKNEFMGIAAHDLRSLLNAVRGYAEMLIEEPDLDQQERLELLARIRGGADRMAAMVQNLLDANRIERGEMKLNLASIDLQPLVKSIVDANQSRAAAKQQSIHFDCESAALPAMVDDQVMVQVLENLVSNAVKYSPVAKSIFVRLKRTAEGVRCEVQDEGPGLSPEDQQKLFGRFARLSAKPTGGESSTGLGLSIVKKMVETMNGRVWCESQPGNGATFIVELPVAGS